MPSPAQSATPGMPAAPVAPRVLTRAQWEQMQAEFHTRVDAATAGHRERRRAGQTHAVEDFLYEYNSATPGQLRRWHPGPGIVLQDADAHAGWKWYRSADADPAASATVFDATSFMAKRGRTVDFVETLMQRTAERPLHVGCFGLHEWAMVYKSGDPDRRHTLPLRLGAEATDAVVEAHPIACTHFDAFRFFTPEARPLNATELTRETQVASEQPGCLHATMDLFKWCLKLSPAIASGLQQDCFDLAIEVRRVDMRASPYDVSSYGLDAIAVETPEGKRLYAAMQRDFAARGAELRLRIVDACRAVRAAA
ncbi:3-methyladenine DNA glycosylase [Demequina aurantiaca]|uniref:3-methyladenine DNA glycosylase n=1 Tax=Demequina aurantiaca TaxID=676200 RepID=UPI003D34CD0B